MFEVTRWTNKGFSFVPDHVEGYQVKNYIKDLLVYPYDVWGYQVKNKGFSIVPDHVEGYQVKKLY